MKAVVAHHLWSRVGGGELVNAYVVKTLLEAGYKVAIVSTFGFDVGKYREWFGVNLENIKVYKILPKMLPILGIYQRLTIPIPLYKAVKREKPDILFIDNELYKPIVKLKKRVGFKLLEYIHFPFNTLFFEKDANDMPREYRETFKNYIEDAKNYFKKYERGLWKYYFKLWLKLYKMVARDNPFETADVVMVNSKYIGKLVKMLWGGDPLVLHPPVKIGDFAQYCRRGFEERENAVIMIGRISPEKRIETAIDAIALTETKPVLRVVGGLIPSNIPYMEKLKRRARERKVRVEFYPNASRSKLVELATKSRVFIHTTIGEHFGIAVVEGMAAGCPVIVHRSGGPWEDIVEFGWYGLSFETVEELAEAIDKLLSDQRLWKYYHNCALERAPFFSDHVFSKKLLKVIEGA